MKTKTCITPGCTNKANHGKVCGTCNCRKARQKNVTKYCYSNLKSNAKKRGVPFELTFEEFQKFAIETQLITKRGKKKNSLTIDRKNPLKGYRADNIQPLTLSENAKKHHTDKKLIYIQGGEFKYQQLGVNIPDEDLPF